MKFFFFYLVNTANTNVERVLKENDLLQPSLDKLHCGIGVLIHKDLLPPEREEKKTKYLIEENIEAAKIVV